MSKLFVIAIGGTGMRCLESFVHLCAAGLFDGQEIDILTLDTDQTNGNKGKVENLINLYNDVKTNDAENVGGAPHNNTFFSAKLNLYKFFTDYSTPQRQTLSSLTQTSNLDQQQRNDNQDIADLLFERDTVQVFPLDHGYRAQTHLGSMLMYHGIIEAAINAKKKGAQAKPEERDLKAFLELLNKNANNARVFVFGSVFGGTGASSIPVIPLAINESLKIITGGNNVINLNKVVFGSTLLTDYFTFNSPSQAQISRDKVIADANNFALNSQAALSFYNEDVSVMSTYKRMYHIGWPSSLKIDYSAATSNVATGGHEQENPCHIAELMCACAAYDFFKANSFPNQKTEIVYRTVEELDGGGLHLIGDSFVGTTNGSEFENKLGALFSLAHIILSKYDGAKEDCLGTNNFLASLEDYEINDYGDLTDEQAKKIDKYLKEFAYKIVGDKFCSGWIYQIFNSIGQGTFLFTKDSFVTNPLTVKYVDPGNIFLDDKHNWDYAKLGLSSVADRRFDKFINIVRQDNTFPSEDQATTVKEKFLAHLYNAITEAQHY